VNAVSPAWSSVYHWIAIGLTAGVMSYFASFMSMRLARRAGMIALPGERQSHSIATPTGGGLGMVFTIVVITAALQQVVALPGFWWQYLFPGFLLLAIVGWRDDRVHVSSWVRLLVQLAVSLWLLASGLSGYKAESAVFLTGAVLALVWFMNLYNFMDGSDGMAGFQGVFAGLVMTILFYSAGQHEVAMIAFVVAFACVGFLPLNFPRARVFMGDVASVPMGFLFASLAVYGVQTGTLDLPVSILIMAVFIIDATLTLLTRVIRRERWYTAHAQHVYQRLIAQGWPHSKVMMVYQIINVVLILPAIMLAEIYPQYAMATAGLTLLLIGLCWLIANRRLGVIAKGQLK
jgi:Fuc2NAc and GlcNAc transferase